MKLSAVVYSWHPVLGTHAGVYIQEFRKIAHLSAPEGNRQDCLHNFSGPRYGGRDGHSRSPLTARARSGGIAAVDVDKAVPAHRECPVNPGKVRTF